ncbi:MAG TPA: hypothetical protein VE524_04250 [Nitrososphaeraceae archaeon]|jgi:hypothetical protein|nr:hypothetical protein [Nitrososphaeraceae archaeon]
MNTRQILIITLFLIATSLLVVTQNTRTIISIPIISAQTSDGSTGTDLSTTGIIAFTYTKLGVLNGNYERIIYDSKTNGLSVSINTSVLDSGMSSSGASSKQVSASDEKNLEQLINKNGFFQASSIYPPNTTDAQDYILNILNVRMDNRMHTVLWADTSSNVPGGLISIVQAIENIASK